MVGRQEIFRVYNEAMKLRGFTLIELLVVISIIGVLASIVLVSLNGARAKSKNTHILSSANQISNQMEASSTYSSIYPGNNAVSGGGPETLTAAPWTTGPLGVLYADITAQGGSAGLKVYESGPNRAVAVYVTYTDVGGYCVDNAFNKKAFTTGTGFTAASNFSNCASATGL